MTQEDKELLLKDLCARLDTNLVCSICRTDDEGVGYRDEILHGYCKGDIWYEFYFREDCSIGIDDVSKIKPYLFPLSSMTEEQMEELKGLCNMYIPERFNYDDYHPYAYRGIKVLYKHVDYNYKFDFKMDVIDWFNKNHFDYRGLIPMGLAIDATGKGIY